MSKALAQSKKAEGNNFFKNKNYREAISKYSEAIEADPSDVTFYSNRSACFAALEEWEKAADDGRQCIITDKSFVKGYFRAGLALKNMKNYDGAMDAVKRGLGIDSTNKDLKAMVKELEELIRNNKVTIALETAEKQYKGNDITGAFKTLEMAMRLEPEHRGLNKLMDSVRPKYEMSEKHRLANLDPKERMKEEGDTFFKAANFEAAIKAYTKCLDAISDKSSDLAIKCYNNRAACHKQLSNFDGTIGDSTNVLEYRPDDIKALMRRAQAFEAVERYKSALQDVRQVLSYGMEKVGKSTYDLANGMQHRLNKVIQQLKSG